MPIKEIHGHIEMIFRSSCQPFSYWDYKSIKSVIFVTVFDTFLPRTSWEPAENNSVPRQWDECPTLLAVTWLVSTSRAEEADDDPVDGWNLARKSHRLDGALKPMVNNGINYHSLNWWVCRISAINSQYVCFFSGRVKRQRLTTCVCRSDVDKQREQRLNRPLGADIQIILVILGANKKDRDHSMGPIWGGILYQFWGICPNFQL